MTEPVFVEEKPMEGREVEATPGAVIGREGTDIVLQDPEVSRRHAAIREHGDGIAIEDLGSTNGTFVNDRKVDGIQPLSDGDSVRLGNTVWRVRAPAAAADTGATRVGHAQVGGPQVTAARAVPSDLGSPSSQETTVRPAAAAPAAAAEAPAGASGTPAAPSGPLGQQRGDVPAPPLEAPSAIRRVLPPTAAQQKPAFLPPSQRRVTGTRGSAAKQAQWTIVSLAIVIAVAVAVSIYFATY